MKRFLNAVIKAIYPKKCICCGEIIADDKMICNRCDIHIERIENDNICKMCGCEKEDCVCKYNIYRFEAIIFAFRNTGIAKNTYYRYKFGQKQHHAQFFADELYAKIEQLYNDVDFDIICAVPSFDKFGFNHSKYIAQAISQKMGITFDAESLICVKKRKKQHKSSVKERLKNVEGKYLCKTRKDGKKILLIDDIKTTGATLDECAKELLFSGAECVYCATLLGGAIK